MQKIITYNFAQFFDNIVDNGCRLGVDNPLRTAGQAVNLPLTVTSRRNGGDFVNAGRHLASAVFERFPKIINFIAVPLVQFLWLKIIFNLICISFL